MLVAHVLVADDDPDICDLVVFAMQSAGHTTHAVADGTSALEALCTTQFALAILDVSMPGATGIEVVRQVRAVDPDRTLPIILFSANCTESDIRRGLVAGANEYLPKPVALTDLRRRVAELLAAGPAFTRAV